MKKIIMINSKIISDFLMILMKKPKELAKMITEI